VCSPKKRWRDDTWPQGKTPRWWFRPFGFDKINRRSSLVGVGQSGVGQPDSWADHAPLMSLNGQSDSPGNTRAAEVKPQRIVKRRVAWSFAFAWNASLLICVVCLHLVYRPSGPWRDANPLDLARAFGIGLELVVIAHGWLLALGCYALLVSARFRRLVFEPWVTGIQVRGPLWGCALLWTVLPAIGAVHLMLTGR
jgi:hypothetical protein